MKRLFHFGFATLLLLSAVIAGSTRAQLSASSQDLSRERCRQIAVFGAVRKPGRLDAPLGLRLLDVLGRAGGPNEWAGRPVHVVHTCDCSPCDKQESQAGDVNEYNLANVLFGRAGGNPFVVPGDVVIVTEADSVFVIGNVRKAQSLPFAAGMTPTRALAFAGGVGRISDLVVVRIHRRSADATRQDIIFSLKAIRGGQAELMLLQPWDVVEVSDDEGHFRPLRLPYPTWDPPLIHRGDTSCS